MTKKENLHFSNEMINYFNPTKSAFGSTNLLSNHLPSNEEEIVLVKNNIDIAMIIDEVNNGTFYKDIIKNFVNVNKQYLDHYNSFINRYRTNRLEVFSNALKECMKTVNIFSPLQCNLACKGCYTNSISINKNPYNKNFVDAYFNYFCKIMNETREMGVETVYTSGDGELLSYPRFFDLAEKIKKNNMKWLFFTAGLNISSEKAAKYTYDNIIKFSSEKIKNKIKKKFDESITDKPYRESILNLMKDYANIFQIYHSVWSTNSKTNTKMRSPLYGNYEYQTISLSNGNEIEIPSSVLSIKDIVFANIEKPDYGIQMPVAEFNENEVLNMASFVYDHRLKSYFEPIIITGRNDKEILPSTNIELLKKFAPILVRSSCGFRNIYQPTFKIKKENSETEFYCSPGMGISIKDLNELNATSNKISLDGNIFTNIFSSLNIYSNFFYFSGCKCNIFAQKMIYEKDNLKNEINEVMNKYPIKSLETIKRYVSK